MFNVIIVVEELYSFKVPQVTKRRLQVKAEMLGESPYNGVDIRYLVLIHSSEEVLNPIICEDDGINKYRIVLLYFIMVVEPRVNVKSSIKTSPPGFLLFMMTRQ